MQDRFRSVLVVCTRRIGDVLLATPLLRSLKAAHPGIAVDMLVFDGTQAIIESNPDIGRVWTVNERPGARSHLALLRAIWRRYDLALSVLSGDRPTLYAWIAGRYRVGTLQADDKSRWKRKLLNAWVPFDNLNTHTVAMNLRLLEPLGIEPLSTPMLTWRCEHEEEARRVFPAIDSSQRYAVLHVSPKFAYKEWTVDGWAAVGHWCAQRDLTVLLAGGAAQHERLYAEQVRQRLPARAVDLAGRMSLPALAYCLSRAAVYVGTDTAVSHMAAAIGTPTVALYGPSNPVKWGPWPKDFPATGAGPWKMLGSQRQGNVFLVQGQAHCVPCMKEGCERHVQSLSDCLQHLAPHRVIAALEEMLV